MLNLMTKKLSGGITYQELEVLADPMRKEVALARKENDSLLPPEELEHLDTLERDESSSPVKKLVSLTVQMKALLFVYAKLSNCSLRICLWWGDNLDQSIGMSKASTQKVCYISFWDELHLQSRKQSHKIGETLFR
ncbi:hypothetical protein YC2023_094412 [Brassica napus]